jgi:hypothetical protein
MVQAMSRRLRMLADEMEAAARGKAARGLDEVFADAATALRDAAEQLDLACAATFDAATAKRFLFAFASCAVVVVMAIGGLVGVSVMLALGGL